MLLNDYKLEKVRSKDGYDVLVINNIYIHSKYSPLKEAASVKYNEKSIVIIFGFGFGYHVNNIINNNPESLFIIYEPVNEIFASYKNYIKHSGDKILIINEIDYSLIIDFMERNKIYSDYKIQMYTNIGYKTLFPELELKYFDTLKNIFKIVIQNVLTESNFIPLWTKNFIYNSISFSKFPVLNIHKKNLDENIAVICSAGPSLEYDINIIKKAREKITIFAVDTVFKTLIKYGIYPDYIISLDGQQYTIDDFINNIPENCTLLLDSICYPKILNIIKSKNIYFTITKSIFNKSIIEYFYNDINHDILKLDTGGTVSDYCLSIAVNMGFKNIYFAGLDLSYPCLQTHARGTPFYDRSLYNSVYFNTQLQIIINAVSKRELIKADSRSGKYVYSDFVMQNYSYYLTQYSKNFDNLNIHINMHDGLKIEGLHEISLETIIGSNISKRQNKNLLITQDDCIYFSNKDVKNFYEKLVETLFMDSCKLKELFEKTDFNNNDLKDLENWQSVYNNIIKNFPFLQKFLIKTDMVLSYKEIDIDKLLWYKHSGYKLIQSIYYIIRIIQKSLKIMDKLNY